jgi:RimJ/RimL family protein N-acetyltransferase
VPEGHQPFSRQAVLRNGTPVRIRGVRPDDRDKVVAAFGRLDQDSVYTRFFSFKKELSDLDLELLHADKGRADMALAVTIGADADEIVIAGCRYIVRTDADGELAAEVAFTVEEDYQGQGIAGMLLAALMEIGRENGIARFEADVLTSNAAMLGVFKRSGLPLTTRREGGVLHLTMELRPSGGAR